MSDAPAPDELLATRRSRRSTAGNRMQAAMAEMAMEDMKDEDDEDFANDKEEEDVFDDDFASTASEADEPAQVEAAAQEEEKRARKARFFAATRARWEKAADAAHARNKATFQPEAEAAAADDPASPLRTRSGRRRVTVTEPTKPAVEGRSRQSKRKQTVLSRTKSESLFRSEQLKKATQKKRVRPEQRIRTQAELIAQALDAEEGNIVEHRDYLKQEEEKRQRARVVRQLWFHHRCSITPYAALVPHPLAPLPPVQRVEKTTRNYVVHEETQSRDSSPSPPPQSSGRSRKQQTTDTETKPSWGSTMTAMFGSHVNWEEVKVYSGQDRPLARPVPICPLTGSPARYREPQSGVPFANAGAYQTLKQVLNHEYVWSVELGAYVRHEQRE
ncbi:YL1-C domain-containing protein [Mycena chlorophos]|uniref:YL1-C domain-containing protein n=1 Tax=Mycena chlorophos TaxID=658473 RepID=A0A8H6THS1_MYCCL|nr:YL1-C domain-containing protein [Mycena chlorophos]